MLVISISILAASMFTLFVYSTKNLEIEGLEIAHVGTSGMGMSFKACNPSMIPVTVEGVEANLHGSSASYGMLAIEGKTIPPLSEETLHGAIDFTDFDTMKTFIDWILNNESKIDFNATILVKTRILEIIPFSHEKNYNLVEFSNMLFGTNHWACKQIANDIKPQLSQVQGRMSIVSLIYSGKLKNNTYLENPNPDLNNSSLTP